MTSINKIIKVGVNLINQLTQCVKEQANNDSFMNYYFLVFVQQTHVHKIIEKIFLAFGL